MSNTQFWLAMGVPTITVLLGIWRSDKRFDTIESRLLVIEADLRRFYQILGEHSKFIEIAEKKIGLS